MLKLKLINGPRGGRQLRVGDTKPVSIGRRNGRLRLHDSRVSKRHAEIRFVNGIWLLRDLDSSNGTYVNEKRIIEEVELETGDVLQMGRVGIKVLRADDIGMDLDRYTPEPKQVSADTNVADAANMQEIGSGLGVDDGEASSIEFDLSDEFAEDPGNQSDGDIVFEVMEEDMDVDVQVVSEIEPEHEPEHEPEAIVGAVSDFDLELEDESRDDEPRRLSEVDDVDKSDASDLDEPASGAPEIVGLSLKHRPPQQPEQVSPEPEIESRPDDEIRIDSDAASDDSDRVPAPDIELDKQASDVFDIEAAFDALSSGLDDSIDGIDLDELGLSDDESSADKAGG